jgi:hypothetical protein
MKQGSADFSDWLSDGIALGPAVISPLTMWGFVRQRWDKAKPKIGIVGEQVRGWIPFGAYIRYIRVLDDPVKRKVFSKDYSAFKNFINPIKESLPGVSKLLPERPRARFDVPAETMKLFFLNMKSIDKKEYQHYVNEQIASGKVRKRQEKQYKKLFIK